jgi:hypothetical protein
MVTKYHDMVVNATIIFFGVLFLARRIDAKLSPTWPQHLSFFRKDEPN